MSEGEYECDRCGDTIHPKDALRRHSNDQHPGEQLGGFRTRDTFLRVS